jgi:hypothetical protein
MNDSELQEQLAAYRAVTENAAPPVGLAATILTTTPGLARTRRSLRDARRGLLVAVLLGVTGELWALRQSSRAERDLYVLVSLWSEGP